MSDRTASRTDPGQAVTHAMTQGCAPACTCRSIPRRVFLKTAAAAGASLPLLPRPDMLMAGPFENDGGGIKHLVPADKKLNPEWVQRLFDRGSSRVCRGPELATIGMPVGGVAAGQLYLCGDGRLGIWQVFNKHHFSGYGATNYQYRSPDFPVDQGFAVILHEQGGARALPLDIHGFPDVEFTGEYPIGVVRYAGPHCPLRVRMEAFSPFIPLNAPDSALPATAFEFTLENVSDRPVRAQLAGWLENAVCLHSAQLTSAERTTRIARGPAQTSLCHGIVETPHEQQPASPRPKIALADFEGTDYGAWTATGEAFGPGPAPGTLPDQNPVSGFLGRGLVNTYRNGDGTTGRLRSPTFVISRRFLNFLVGGGGYAGQTCMNLLVDGRVVRTATGANDEKLSWSSWHVGEFAGQEAHLEIVDEHTGGWGHINIDQIELADEAAGPPPRPLAELEDYGTLVLALAGEAAGPATGVPAQLGAPDVPWLPPAGQPGEEPLSYPAAGRRKAALLATPVDLAPGARATARFVLAWHFPNHPRGHAYANRFDSAQAVAGYVLAEWDRLAGQTRLWHDTYYQSSLPHWLLDRLHSTAANLATGTCQWWGDGRFWAWEGVGCCHGTCTHVWNYAHTMARLFPELERSVREMQDLGEALHPDGLVGFRGERNGSYAADGQVGTVLKCYREHQMSADAGFLARNWPNIKKVLEYSIRQDADDDGLIENSQHNTYDINFEGPNTFVGALYLAALRAGEEMAREMGDTAFADRLRAIFESGCRQSVERLWNGEYFVQRVDLEKHPQNQYGDGCLSDQLFGQGWAHQLGLGYLYPTELVRKALQAVWTNNWAPDVGPHNAVLKPERWFVSPGEAGLFTCTWPKSAYLAEGVRYREEVWTGIEYQVAGHMIWEGMLAEALVMIRAIHDRYDPVRHNPWNEIECGDHYARALASWGAYLALAGFECHGPKAHLGFAPRIMPEDFRAAFTTASGWGSFAQRREGGVQTERIEVRWGALRLRTLAFAAAADARFERCRVTLAGREVPARMTQAGERVTIALAEEVQIGRGECVEVELS